MRIKSTEWTGHNWNYVSDILSSADDVKHFNRTTAGNTVRIFDYDLKLTMLAVGDTITLEREGKKTSITVIPHGIGGGEPTPSVGKPQKFTSVKLEQLIFTLVDAHLPLGVLTTLINDLDADYNPDFKKSMNENLRAFIEELSSRVLN